MRKSHSGTRRLYPKSEGMYERPGLDSEKARKIGHDIWDLQIGAEGSNCRCRSAIKNEHESSPESA